MWTLSKIYDDFKLREIPYALQTESAARQAIKFCGPFFFLDPGPQTQLNPDMKHFLTV